MFSISVRKDTISLCDARQARESHFAEISHGAKRWCTAKLRAVATFQGLHSCAVCHRTRGAFALTTPECLVIYARHGTEGNGGGTGRAKNRWPEIARGSPHRGPGVEPTAGNGTLAATGANRGGLGVNRTFMFLSAVLGFGAMVYLASVSHAQPAGPPGGAPAPSARPTIAVFNMAAVMREFGEAKYKVYLLNKKRTDMSKDLLNWRGQYLEIQKTLQTNPNHPEKDKLTKQIVDLARAIEDKDNEINKALNKDASDIISDLYDKIKLVVDKTAEMNGYHIVFAYPDAVTPEEHKSAYIKELKLKPPAAQPFYVAPHVDITGVVVKTLNSWYAAPAVPETPAPAPGPGGPTGGPVPGGPGGLSPAPGGPGGAV